MMEEYFPIKNITTYTSNWTIKARVIDKAPLRQLRDTMHIMHVDIVDKHGDTIRAKFWGKAAIKWDEVLQKGKVYTFAKGAVDLSNKKFNSIPHNYEIRFYEESTIEPAEDKGDIVMDRHHQWLSLRDIKSLPNVSQGTVDILCIVNSVTPSTSITTKTGKDISRRKLTIVDDSGYEMELILWGDFATLPMLEDAEGKVIVAAGLSVKEWQGGRSCQTIPSSEIKLGTEENVKDQNRLSQLKEWFESARNSNKVFKTMKPQTQAARESYEPSDIANVLTKTKGGYVLNAKLRKISWKNKDGNIRLWYHACPMCTKKVLLDEDSNKFKCISCGDAVVTPSQRYFFHCTFIDYTGKINAQISADIGERMLCKTPKELDEMSEDQRKIFLDGTATHRDFKVTGYLKGHMYNGETRYQLNVTRIDPLDYHAEAMMMLEAMQISYDSVLSFLGINSEEREAKMAKVDTEAGA